MRGSPPLSFPASLLLQLKSRVWEDAAQVLFIYEAYPHGHGVR